VVGVVLTCGVLCFMARVLVYKVNGGMSLVWYSYHTAVGGCGAATRGYCGVLY